MNGIFLTDLHLFSHRSHGQAHWEELLPSLSGCDRVILGGDIFDLRWSTVGDFDATLEAAYRWLTAAVQNHDRTHWHFLLGNHDCHPRFQAVLNRVQEEQERFSWSPLLFEQGPDLFLHGDVIDAGRSMLALDQFRAKFHEEKPRGKIGNLLYATLLQTRLHRTIPEFLHTPEKTSRKLLQFLSAAQPDALDGVENIYFGHTHVPVDGYRFDRYRFYNPGSGIRHLDFAPVPFRVR
ncbi:MAG: metallophosphoesterase [Pirellulales bacterium]